MFSFLDFGSTHFSVIWANRALDPSTKKDFFQTKEPLRDVLPLSFVNTNLPVFSYYSGVALDINRSEQIVSVLMTFCRRLRH